MSDIQELRREYRAMHAPRQLAARIRAATSVRQRPRRWLRAALAAGLPALAILVALPLMRPTDTPKDVVRPTSMSVLSMVAERRPSMSPPSLSAVQGVSLRPPPARPPVTPEAGGSPIDQTPETLRNDARDKEENEHANV